MAGELAQAFQERSDKEALDYMRSLQQGGTPPTPPGATAAPKPLTVGEALPKASAASSGEGPTEWRGFAEETAGAGRAMRIGTSVIYEQGRKAIDRTLTGLYQFALPDTGSTTENANERMRGLGNVLTGIVGLGFAPIAGGAEALMTPILERHPWLKDYQLAEGATAQAMRDVLSGGIPLLVPGQGLIMIRPSDAIGGQPFGQGGTLGKAYKSLEEYRKDSSPLTAAEALHAGVATALAVGVFKGMESPPPTKAGGKAGGKPAAAAAEPAAPAAPSATIKGGASISGGDLLGDTGQVGQGRVRMEIDPAQLETLRQVALDESAGGMPTESPRAFGINWERLGTDESVKRVTLAAQKTIREGQEAMAIKATGEVTSTGYGGVRQTHAQTAAEAARNYFTLDDVIQGRFIRPGDTIDMLAARKVALESLRDGMAKFFQDTVQMANAGDAMAQADLPVVAGLHQLVVDRAYRFQSAIARAQETGKMQTDPMLGPVPREAIDNFVKNLTSEMDGATIAKAYQQLSAQQGKVAAASWMRNTFAQAGKMAWTYFVTAKLSSPVTWIKNAAGNLGTMAYNVEQRMVMRGLHKVFWPEDLQGTQAGAVSALVTGYEKATMDTLKLAAPKRFGGQGVALKDLPGVTHWDHPNPIAASEVGIPGAARLVEAAQAGDAGGVITALPGAALDAVGGALQIGPKMLEVTDHLSAAVNFGAEVRANANNLARVELRKYEGKAGYEDRVAARIAEIETNLDKYPQVTDPAREAAQRLIYTQPLGQGGQAYSQWLNSVPGLRLNNVFVNIPINLSKRATHLFPPTWVASRIYGEMGRQWNMGGAAREAAAADLANGLLISTGIGLLYAGGKLTGSISEDRAELERAKDAGVKQYTFYPEGQGEGKPGISGYHLVAPIGITLGAMVDTFDAISKLPQDSPWYEKGAQILAASGLALAHTLKHEPFFQGWADFFDAMSQPDRDGKQWLTNFVRGLVPTGLQKANHVFLDEHLKEIRGPLDALKASLNLPGVVDKRDVIDGHNQTYPQGVGPDMVAPFSWAEGTASRAKQELWDQKIKVPRFPWVVAGSQAPADFVALRPPGPNEGVLLTGEQRDRWIVLTTQEVRVGGLTQEQALDKKIGSLLYSTLPVYPDNISRQAELHRIIGAYRQEGLAKLRLEYRDLDVAMGASERLRLQKQLPVTHPLSRGTPPPDFSGLPHSLGR